MGSETYSVPFLGDFDGLNIPILFIAIIFAAIGSSFPDTIISYKDAQKGNYDDAISNAYGSNIFNLCVALGLPLLFFTVIYGPIILDENIINLITNLSLWFVGLTLLSIIFYTRNGGVRKWHAYTMISTYFIFVFYILYMAYIN